MYSPFVESFKTGLNLGANEIDIFVCNGNPPSPRIAPGPTIDKAGIACPTPSSRGYSYLLFDGDVTLETKEGITHHPSVYWDERTVDEPASLVLLFITLLATCFGGTRFRWLHAKQTVK